ncbi:MAG: YwhD family protein [Alicyclobacillaceae bacterium]|nr:YwhD family protein [Alicyclobacillaceae bacterium]
MEELSLTGRSRHDTPEGLEGLTAVVIDGDAIWVDRAALHAKSRVERGIQFSDDEARRGRGRRVAVVWVSMGRSTEGRPCLKGLAACDMWIDDESKTGYKRLAEHVNQMDRAVKGRIELGALSREQKQRLARFFAEEHGEVWEATDREIRDRISE